MSEASPQDPFEQVILKIWSQILEKHDGITDNVRAGNRIKRTSGENPTKRNAQNADFPALDVIPGSWTRTSETNDSLIGTHTYQVMLATGSQDVDKYLTLLLWELIRAFEKAERDGDGAFNLGLDYVTSISLDSFDASDSDAELQRGRRQWTGIGTITAEFSFDRDRHLSDNAI